MDPDFITGYNIFGFDFKYIYERSKILFPCHHKCPKSKNKDSDPWYHVKECPMKEFMNFGKMDSVPYKAKDHKCKKCTMKTQQLSSSALGDNTLHYIMMDGRILFDIQKEVQKGHNLESYKLDNVASHFMRGKLKSVDHKEIIVSDTGTLKDGDFISFRTHTNIGEGLFEEGRKYKIDVIHDKMITLTEDLNLELEEYQKVEWCLNKDDISPQQIFDKHKYEGPSGRAEVAKYCVQDCELCIHLLLLLDIVPNNLGMANVSYVPASFIFLRGQGVKVTSVVARKCSERNTRIPDLKKIPRLNDYIKMYKNGKTKEEIFEQIIEDADWRKPESYELEDWYNRSVIAAEKGIDGFEGAIVLDPKPGIYLDDPVSVLDYASLYPSSIIEKNISHETHIEDHSLLPLIGKENYHKVEYQNWIYINKGKGDTIEKKLGDGKTTCYFLKPEYMKEKGMVNDKEPLGIIPAVLNHLLSARTATKKAMKKEPNEFKKKVLDGLQLAYKVTANSVYGQLGARTSTIFKMNLAACTTSVGRSRIDDASNGVTEWALKKGYEEPDVIYGDTDSVFVKFSRIKDGKTLVGKDALKHCILCGQEAGEYITKGILKVDNEDGTQDEEQHEPLLCHPQDLEYEKTFWPFILISKKRYTGDKYEIDPDDCKRTSMGIVLKRRDNAQIVKHVFGNVIEKIMIDKDFKLTLDWLKETLQMIRNGEFSMRYFVITKALRGYYKNPKGIAHKVLADRMAERDPGNKPKSNDRIPYAYINKGKTKEIIGYKKIKDRRKIGEFKNGKPRFKNFMIDDLSQPKYKKINILQGDKIEHIDYIKDKKLDLDYEFYITNQIMNPVKQVLDLEMDPKETEQLFSK
jgi:DNA polymerase elongation subunit (family B)